MTLAKTVFLIDDDADDREVFQMGIESLGGNYRYAEAVDGEDGLNKLRQGAVPRPDVIFLDLNMPRIDGRQFLKAIKMMDEFSDIPVFIYSTSSIEQEKINAIQHGAAGFITKHYAMNDLCRELEDVFHSVFRDRP
jgi:CheY-like chemotaxis protein